MTNTGNWQEKCLAALDRQDQLEKHVNAQSDLLRRLVINLGAAAAGLDPELDAVVVLLKEKLRGANGTVVHDHLIRLERTVRQFEEKRQNYHQQNIQAIASVVSNLSQLNLSAEFLKELGNFKRQLSKTSFSLPLVPEQLLALARLHAQAIVASKEPEQSLWRRIRGKTQLRFETQERSDSPIQEGSEVKESQAHASVRQHLDQPGWDVVNEEIKLVLDDVLGTFNTGEQSSAKWQSAKMRLQSNMDWHQLVETLEDFRDLLSERTQKTDLGMSEYLNQVNEELHEICERLGVSVAAEHQHEIAVDTLGKAVTQQVAQMQSMVANSTNLESLKTDISQQINVISAALNDFRTKNAAARPLSEELHELIKKVKTIESESERTRQLLAQEQHRASHDTLTELPNRNAYNHRVVQEWHRYKRYDRPLCIAVCDIDHFKSFNDTYGHQIGDRVLRLIAKSLFKRLRAVDFVARYGGEEFVVLLPETNLDNAFKVLDSARAAIGDAAFRFKDKPVNLTFSCGVTEFSKTDSVDTAFARADQGLYKAKENGRNQTVRVDAE